MFDRGFHTGDEFRVELQAVVDAARGAKTSFIRRTENGPSLAEDAGRVLVIQRHIADGIDQSFVSLEESHDLKAVRIGALHNAANDGMEAGTVAAGGEDSDPFCLCHGDSAGSPPERVKCIVPNLPADEVAAADNHQGSVSYTHLRA